MPDLKRLLIGSVRQTLRAMVPLLRLMPWAPSAREPANLPEPSRILLLHPGHLGDIVISTAVLEPLRRRYPGTTFGFVVGSGSAHVLDGIPGIEAVYVLDHWRLNRADISLTKKWQRYATTRACALRSLRAAQYDVAICLFNEDPDLLDVAWSARIPVRIGFRKSYFAPLATRTVEDLAYTGANQVVRQAQTLTALDIVPEEEVRLRSELAPDTEEALAELSALVQEKCGALRVIHMGAGACHKEMSPALWRAVAKKLSPNHTLLFTGRGAREAAMANEVADGLRNCIIACNRLSWRGFVAAIRAAEMLYSVDSMAGHVAAAVGTPSVIAFSGVNSIERWRPYSAVAAVVTRPEPCAPCHLPGGCPPMPCKQLHASELLTIPTVRRIG